MRGVRLRCDNIADQDLVRIGTAGIDDFLGLQDIFLSAFHRLVESHIVNCFVFRSNIDRLISSHIIDRCFKTEFRIGVGEGTVAAAEQIPAQEGLSGLIGFPDRFQFVTVLDDLIVDRFTGFVGEGVGRSRTFDHFIHELIGAAESLVFNDDIDREPAGLELCLGKGIRIGDGCIVQDFRVLIVFDMNDGVDRIDGIRAQGDFDRCSRFDFFPFVPERDIDCQGIPDFLLGRIVDQIVDLCGIDRLDDHLGAFVESAFRSDHLDVYAVGAAVESDCRHRLLFRLRLFFRFFDLFELCRIDIALVEF